MKKIFFIATLLYCFIVLLLLTPKPILAQKCNCISDIIQGCIDTTPPGCPAGETCRCLFNMDPASGSISCDPGTCVALPTPTPITCTCPIDYTSNSCAKVPSTVCEPIEVCECEAEFVLGGITNCKPGICVVAATPIPTPTGADKYGKCDPFMTATGCIPINIKCEKGYKAIISADCKSCWCEFGGGTDIHGKCGPTAINTAIGCIPTEDTLMFIKWFLGRAILLAGGVAFLMMIAGALMVIVSSGNPEKVKAGSQLITSAIAGLIFIIFSLFLLRLIGIEILQIPGL